MTHEPITELPPRVRAFIDEYKALCDKHGLMVFSDGESVEVGTKSGDDYWDIEDCSLAWLNWLPRDSEERAALLAPLPESGA